MTAKVAPHFHIKNRFQKGGTYRSLLSDEILSDICFDLTGRRDFTVDFDDAGYNIGRLATLVDSDVKYYISVSENSIRSRNSSFQSFPSALSRFILDAYTNKEMCFYVHPNVDGNMETAYFIFMYRLMKTVGVRFLNIGDFVKDPIAAFSSPDELIAAKEKLRSRSVGNNSTYVTKSLGGVVQVYGKTYGANKYETTLICLALLKIVPAGIELYEVAEGGLTGLPNISKMAILAAGAALITTSTTAVEAAEFTQNNSLRSARFIYNLLDRLGKKKCAFCDCEIPEIIHGAHIWPVASIKKDATLSFDDQLRCATDGHNGLWLCENHHSLFDATLLFLSDAGELKYRKAMLNSDVGFLEKITTLKTISPAANHANFVGYLQKRNSVVRNEDYRSFDAAGSGGSV